MLFRIKKPPVSNDDFLSLQNMLYEYASKKFQTNFGFAYNGHQSNPPDRSPGGGVRGYFEVLQANTRPSSVKEVEDWLNAEVFLYVLGGFFCYIFVQANLLPNRRDSLTFPAYANSTSFDLISGHHLFISSFQTQSGRIYVTRL